MHKKNDTMKEFIELAQHLKNNDYQEFLNIKYLIKGIIYEKNKIALKNK